jgi:hypothetical protein
MGVTGRWFVRPPERSEGGRGRGEAPKEPTGGPCPPCFCLCSLWGLCRIAQFRTTSNHAIIFPERRPEHWASCQGVPPSKGGGSVERKIELVIAILQLLLAIAELIRLFKAY